MRRKVKNRNIVKPDLKYGSTKVSKFINYIMLDGKRNAAQKIVYGALEVVKEETSGDPLSTFETALKNAGPVVEVRSRRIGGANYQVPREVRNERRLSLAMRWIIGATRSKKGIPTHKKLAGEIISASKNEGEAIKKKDNAHKMAESNKAFAHFSW